MKTPKLLFLLALPLLTTSCLVSRTKYNLAEAGRLAALYSCDSVNDLLTSKRAEFDLLQKSHNGLREDTTQLRNGIRNYQNLLKTNRNERDLLSTQLNDKMKQLDEREETIRQLRGVIDEQNARVKSLLDNVKSALTGFSSDELTVREEGGKVYVAMSDKLLFESGSAIVNEMGKSALGKLANVLNKQQDIDVYIEGHTDSVPIKTAVFNDNWDLSVFRATSVVRILTADYGVNPMQIQPCGRGEFKPIDTNKTPEGRARNRRTEIIIAPKLDKLYEMISAQ